MTSRWESIFFGPPNKFREALLEETFLLLHHLKIDYGDIMSMPVSYRKWFIRRLTEHYEEQSEELKKSKESNRRRNSPKELPMGEMSSRIGPEQASQPQKGPKSFK